ncbi:MAG: hypothetical protein JRJ87_08350 [Deltaproteobacteria bacterium]|nr:hypothetical protein [Deltaproteobacteria bacterium]
MDELDEPTGDVEVERLSWAAYLGAASGLVVGVILTQCVAATLFWWYPDTCLAEVCWEVGSPLLAILGAIIGSFGFHRLFRGQIWAPVAVFLMILLAGLVIALNVAGFPWRDAGAV